MAAVLIVRDADPERRRLGMQAAEREIQRLDLETASTVHGEIGLVRGAFPGAPLSHTEAAFLMGDVIPGPEPGRLTAAEYAERVAAAGTPPAFDGYHFAATFGAGGALTVAVDVLGMFPVYVAETGGALVVASSPALIAGYPGFGFAIDPLGLAGLLVANGPVRGRTPYRGIRRLARGHALVAAAGGAVREVRQFTLMPHRESHDVPVEECALRIHEALVRASRRHVPDGEPHTMLLSGGLDSRLVLGVLAQRNVPLDVIVRGRSSDLEFCCARRVARHLRLPWRLVPHTGHSFETFERRVRWDGMACVPGPGGGRDLTDALEGGPRRLVSGHLADPFLGGSSIPRSFDPVTRTASFDRYLRRTNAWGVPLDALPRLLRRDVFGDAVREVVDQLREDYTDAGDDHLTRSWIHTMELRQRVGVGHVLGRLAFEGWPRHPQVDREVLHTVAGVPLGLLSTRALEREVLKRFHPGLARLPLDRNDFDTTPLLAGIGDLARAGLDRRVRRLRARLGIPRPERRYYHRLFDFDGEAWRVTRRGAEPDRERACALFEPAAFDALVPRTDRPLTHGGTIESSAAAKLLLGLSVWLRVAAA